MKNGRICERDGAIGMSMTESTLEQTSLAWFENLGYEIEYGQDIAFDGSKPERDAEANYTDVILDSRLLEKQYLR